jgi:23S rRNA-/tRNA-specific pseudouridylate synthase
VANKPAGLLSVPGRGMDKTDSLATRVQNEFPDARSVHRLDMSTSGLLVFARGEDMQRRLSHLFRERGVKKCYIAMVAGRVEITAGEVDLPLGSDWPNRPRQKVDFAIGKPSLTRYRLLTYMESPLHPSIYDVTTGETTSHLTRLSKNDSQVIGYSHSTDETPSHSTRLSKNYNKVAGYRLPAEELLAGHPKDTSQIAGYQGEWGFDTSRVELEPVTGRTHQLRVHMAAIGHPILGDVLYGGEASSGAERLLLHARALSFTHPLSEAPLTLTCEPPF